MGEGGEEGFGEGGVGVDAGGEGLGGEARGHGQGGFGNEVGGVGAADVASFNEVGAVVDDEFYHAVGVTHGVGFSVGAEKGFACGDVDACGKALLFGASHHGAFRHGEHCRRDYRHVNVLAHGDAGLCRCGMCKLADAVAVADGPDSVDIGAA